MVDTIRDALTAHQSDAEERIVPGELPARQQGEQSYAVPGSRRAAEIEKQNAQQHAGKDFMDGLNTTAAAGLIRTIRDETPSIARGMNGGEDPTGIEAIIKYPQAAVLSLTGFRAYEPDFDKDAKYDELTQGIPYEYHDDIMENDGLEAAGRARMRVLDDLERGQRIAQQQSGTLAVLAGSVFDVDLPLTAFSGGAYGSAKVAATALRASRAARLSPRAALRASGTAQGVNAGFQAGVVVGAADAYHRETTGWTDLVNMAFTSALLGGAVGTAVKGDVRVSMRAAQDEFNRQVRTDAPSLREDLDVEQMARPTDTLVPGGDEFTAPTQETSTVGAANLSSPTYAGRTLDDPAGEISGTNQGWIEAADRWRHDSDWGDAKAKADGEWWTRVATSAAGSFSANNFNRLYSSKSAVANWLAGTVFESPSGLGRGRATASTRMENYHKRIQTHIARDIDPAMNAYAKETGQTWQNSGYGATNVAKRQFNREVMLELNDRASGNTNTMRNKHVKRAADQYEKAGAESLSIGRGRDGETPLDGFDAIPDRRGYTPYVWSGQSILDLEAAGVVTRDSLTRDLASAYQRAGMGAGKDAEAVAKAVIQRAVSKEVDIDTSMASLLSGDGKEWLLTTLRDNGVKEADAEALIERLQGGQLDKGKESFAKSRNEVDMNSRITTTDGSDMRIVDLFDQDLHGVWQRYSRRMAGSSALARQGITNRAQRKEIISAMRAEQRALGEEPMEEALVEAMLSHFNGGPVWGYSRGFTNEGIGSEVAVAKRMTNIALLERLGLTQLAETGATMAQNGVRNWFQRGPMAIFDKELKAGNKALLDDMAYFTGRIGDDHRHFATWLDLDDISDRDKGDWLRHVRKFSSNAQFVQGYTSLFNHVRSFQQTTAALGMADKVMRTIKEASDKGENISARDMARFESDLGLGLEDIQALEQLINSGVVEFKTSSKGNTFVNRLNMDQWDTRTGEVFASSLTRNVNQLVQKSMAGEQDAWMHTQWGSVVTHLKTFPMQAFQKQFIRNMRHMDTQNITTLMYGLATAAVAIKVRDAIDGRERTASELGMAAFNYSNMTGFVPMLADPAMTILGLEDYRFNRYGPYTDLTPPVVKIANDMRRIPGALWDTAVGEGDYYDRQALKAIPFTGTYVFSRLFDK